MPSAFKTLSIETLTARRESVEREIASLLNFRVRIDRRITSLKAKQPLQPAT